MKSSTVLLSHTDLAECTSLEMKFSLIQLNSCNQNIGQCVSKVLQLCYLSLLSLCCDEKVQKFYYEDEYNNENILDISPLSSSSVPGSIVELLWCKLLGIDKENSKRSQYYWKRFITEDERKLFYQDANLCGGSVFHYVLNHLKKIKVIDLSSIDQMSSNKSSNSTSDEPFIMFDYNQCYSFGVYLFEVSEPDIFSHISMEEAVRLFNSRIVSACAEILADEKENNAATAIKYTINYISFHMMELEKFDEAIELICSPSLYEKRRKYFNFYLTSKMHGSDCLRLHFFLNRYQTLDIREKVVSCYFAFLELLNDYEFDVQAFAPVIRQQAITLENLGWKNEALLFYESALKRQREARDSINNISFTLKQLGRIYGDFSMYDESLECYIESLALDRKFYGSEHKIISESYDRIAKIYSLKGNRNAAFSFYKESALLKIQIFGYNSMEVALLKKEIGYLYQSFENYDQALKNYDELLEILENLECKKLIPTITFIMGDICKKMGKHSLALQYYDKSLSQEYNYDSNNYQDFVKILESKADSYIELEQFLLGIKFYTNALAVMKSYENVDSILIPLLKKQAYALELSKDFGNAISVYNVILGIKKNEVEDVETKEILIRLGGIFEMNQDYAKAVDAYIKALSRPFQEQIHIKIAFKLQEIGDVATAKHHSKLALRCFNRAKKIRMSMLGPEHIGVSDLEQRIATVFLVDGNYSRAEEYFLSSLKTKRKILGDDIRVADLLHDLAVTKQAKKEYSVALSYALEGLEIRKKEKGNFHMKVAETLHLIGIIMRNMGKQTCMNSYLGKALEIYRELGLKDNHRNIKEIIKVSNHMPSNGKFYEKSSRESFVSKAA